MTPHFFSAAVSKSEPLLARARMSSSSSSKRRKLRSAPDQNVLEDLSDYTCAICMEVQREPRELACGHAFCSECITALVSSTHRGRSGTKKTHECPVCRQPVASAM